MNNTQIAEVLEHLKKNGTITTNEAWELYHITRLSSVIMRLRVDYIITTEMQDGTNYKGEPCRYGIYCYWGEKNAKSENNG